MERAFKGIWIPAEIWLSKDLTLQEKVMIVEIDSLDNHNGCFASNLYFSEFFGISKSRVSQIVNSLKEKGYITIEFEREGRQIKKRIIRINRTDHTYLGNLIGGQDSKEGSQFSKQGGKYPKEGCLENAKDNNTIYNNKDNNINNNIEKPIRHKHGEYNNVLLSDKDFEKLKNEFPNDYPERIDRLSYYMKSTGKSYKDHLATIRNWARKDKKQQTRSASEDFMNIDF